MSEDKGALEYIEEFEEHTRTAVRCVDLAAREMRGEFSDIPRANYWLSLGQIHATLANATATRLMVECYDGHQS